MDGDPYRSAASNSMGPSDSLSNTSMRREAIASCWRPLPAITVGTKPGPRRWTNDRGRLSRPYQRRPCITIASRRLNFCRWSDRALARSRAVKLLKRNFEGGRGFSHGVLLWRGVDGQSDMFAWRMYQIARVNATQTRMRPCISHYIIAFLLLKE